MSDSNANDKSQSIPGAVFNLALAIPPAMFRALANKVLQFINAYFKNMLKLVLNIDTNSKTFEHEVDKSKKMAKILMYITTEVLKQPDVQKLFLELVEELRKVLKQINDVLESTLEQSQEIIETQGERAEKAAYKISRRTVGSVVDGALDAAGGIPAVGNVLSAVRAAADVIQPIQELTQESLKLFIHTANDVVKLLKKNEIAGAAAANASITAITNAMNLSKTITGKIDTLRNDLKGEESEETTNQKGGAKNKNTCACIKFSKKDLPKVPSEENIIGMIDNTRNLSVKKIDAIGGDRETLNISTKKTKNNNDDYVPAKDIPSPSFLPPKKAAYILASEPRAGLKLPPKIEKALKDMTKLAENAKKEAEKRKKQFNDAKKMTNDAMKMANDIKKAPGEFKKQAKNTVNSAKKQAKNTVNSAKKQAKNTVNSAKKQAKNTVNSAKKELKKGGRRSKTNRRKSRARKRRTRKNKTH